MQRVSECQAQYQASSRFFWRQTTNLTTFNDMHTSVLHIHQAKIILQTKYSAMLTRRVCGYVGKTLSFVKSVRIFIFGLKRNLQFVNYEKSPRMKKRAREISRNSEISNDCLTHIDIFNGKFGIGKLRIVTRQK